MPDKKKTYWKIVSWHISIAWRWWQPFVCVCVRAFSNNNDMKSWKYPNKYYKNYEAHLKVILFIRKHEIHIYNEMEAHEHLKPKID